MAKSWRGKGAGDRRSLGSKSEPVGRVADAAQARNSPKRSYTACGSAEKRPSDAWATSTALPSTNRTSRPSRLAIRMSAAPGCGGVEGRDGLDDEVRREPDVCLVEDAGLVGLASQGGIED